MTAAQATTALQRHTAAKAAAFNARFARGQSVMYLPTPAASPQWDRVYSMAFVDAGRAVVRLAGRAAPVDVDKILPAPIEVSHVRGRPGGMPLTKLAVAFLMGFCAAVLIGAYMAPANAVAPEHIVIDCAEPDATPEPTDERGQA